MRCILFPILVLALALSACCNPCNRAPTAEIDPGMMTLTIYFTDTARYQVGNEPYETAVTRMVPVSTSLPEAVLTQLFLGPTETETAQGLVVLLNGGTGFKNLAIKNGVARVTLTGTCASNGATYTIANLIYANLKQFSEIQWVKIYDQYNETESPDGEVDSIPNCLEP